MQILKPSYYDQFKCIADQCPNTCCQNWNIDIDKNTFIKYQNVHTTFGKKLRNHIIMNKNPESPQLYARFKLSNKKCPFLNQNNLCDVYNHLGEDYMCDTCKIFPRGIKKYTNFCERTLNLSCPEVTRLLVASDTPFSFDITEEELSPLDLRAITKFKYDEQVFNLLFEARLLFIEIAQHRVLPLWKRLIFIKLSESQLQDILDTNSYHRVPNLISTLKEMIINEKTITQLDNIQVKTKTKTLAIADILQLRADQGLGDLNFAILLQDLNTFYHNNNFESLSTVNDAFDIYFMPRDYIFENYIVNHLYGSIMSALSTLKLNFQVFRVLINYIVLKQLFISQWSINNNQLTDEQIINIIQLFSKEFDHDKDFALRLYAKLKHDGYDQLVNLASLIK